MPLKSDSASKSKFELKKDDFTAYLQKELELELNKDKRETLVYDYQIKAALQTQEHFKTYKKNAEPAIIVAPTGSGKSGILTMLPYVLGSAKVLVLSPAPVITEQLAACFGKYGLESSFFNKVKLIDEEAEFQNYVEYPTVIMSTGDVKGMSLPNLVIVNAQKFGGNSNTSLVRRKKKVRRVVEEKLEEEIVKDVKKTFESFSTIIVDEAHHYPAETWKAVVDNFNEKQIVFLTATPYHRENPILENQKITFEIKKEDIEGKTIRKCEFKELSIELSEKYLEKTQIEKIGQNIASILEEHDRLESTVTHKAMVLVKSSKQEAENVATFLGNATYYTSDKKAKNHKKDFEKDKFRILVVCGSLLEGYDNSDVSVCVILRNVRRRVIFTQFVGRCLRTSRVDDPVSAVLLSYGIYNQQQMWDQYRRNEIAENDPQE